MAGQGMGRPPGELPRRPASFAADRARRTANADRWLASLLGAESGVALVAVGGYGRRELLPGSDLDVLLLHHARPGIAALADRIWYPIWDSGTRLDHAVRRPAHARAVARSDLRVALGLLHARHVAGDPQQLREEFTGEEDRISPPAGVPWNDETRAGLPERFADPADGRKREKRLVGNTDDGRQYKKSKSDKNATHSVLLF